MIIVPNQKPVARNLNSYYLDIRKLVEHYQGEIGTGGIHLKAPAMEGILFFDKDHLLNGTVHLKGGEETHGEALESLIEASDKNNFIIDVYQIENERIYFWANMATAETLYQDLNSEFTDIQALIKKMQSERLTGFIDVAINGGKDHGLVFFSTGKIIGGSYSWEDGSGGDRTNLENAVRKIKAEGGIFNVRKIQIDAAPMKKPPPAPEAPGPTSPAPPLAPDDIIEMLEPFINIFERVVMENRKAPQGFQTLLKKKFVEKADVYDFLDPFAAEFEYESQKIRFAGRTDGVVLAKGVVECVRELADELKLKSKVMEALTPWLQKYADDMQNLDIHF